MSRNRRCLVKPHRHCETCFRSTCRAPLEISTSCLVVRCRQLCGAAFHMCKEEEHQLLCPREKVPCLNVDYGCPFTMWRSQLAQHLQVCPASVVCCSMDWNRWPVTDEDRVFYANVSKEPLSSENLDISTALRDQVLLCKTLKMRTFFPELMDKTEEITDAESEGAAGDGYSTDEEADGKGGDDDDGDPMLAEVQQLSSGQAEASANNKGKVNERVHNMAEKMFSKERSSCMTAEKAVESDQKPADEGVRKASSSLQVPEEPSEQTTQADIATGEAVSKTGFAPWDEGVLERLGKELKPRDFNMYLVHHGRMLIRFGQMDACTPKEKDFVYGSLEPIPVQTLRSFKVPTSYKEKRIHLKDPATRVKTEDKSVDTADLGWSEEEMPKMDEMEMTLLCSAEKELRGHKICETVATDGLFIDFATQTYNFSSAPFRTSACLSDVVSDRLLSLHVQVQTEGVTSRHNKSCSAFTFLCGHFFRRDEFPSHFRNVHTDIQTCLDGWFEERCPLAYLGCTYSQKRFHPSTHRATVRYHQELSTFTLRPEVSAELFEGVKSINTDRKRARNVDALSRLPFEVLVHISGFLDSFSLSQLALVSRLMRQVCSTLLKERGMVVLKWEKKIYSHGGSRWKSKKVWQFSNLFSTVDQWSFGRTASMSEHLKRCPYYHTENRREPVALVNMCKKKNEKKTRQSLVTMFFGQK